MERGLEQGLPDVNITRTSDHESTVDFFNTRVSARPSVPELIILDLYLPTRQQGPDLLGWMRNFLLAHHLTGTAVLVFSQSDRPQDIRDSYAGGANAYLVKSQGLDTSVSYFKDLCHFWWSTITLPQKSL